MTISPRAKTRGAYSRLNAECQYVYEQNLLIDTLTSSRLSFTLQARDDKFESDRARARARS